MLGGFSLLCCASNAATVLARRGSCVPFIGGIAGMVAFRIAPWPELAEWAWTPLVADLGCGLLALGLVVALVCAAFEKRPPPPPLPPMKLLMVEDHRVFAETARATVLVRHEVVIAGGVCAAIAALGRFHFDVVLLDHDLPDGTGIDVLRWKRLAYDHGRILDTPVVAISAEPANNELLRAAGARAICGKLELARIDEVLREVRPDGGQRAFCWRLSRAASEDGLVAAVAAYAIEAGVAAVVVTELARDPPDYPIAIGDELSIDDVGAAIRASLRGAMRFRATRDTFAIEVGAGFVCIEAACWCAEAFTLARHDFGVRVDVVTPPR